jgi:hypothetical protein
MKTLLSLVVAVGLTYSVAAAQDLSGNANNSVAGMRTGTDIGGFRAPAKLNQTPNESSKFPNTHPDLRPQFGGVLVDGPTKYGAELINPAAPASYGYGAKYLSAPSSMYDLQHESGPAAHRDAGGIKLLSFEF